MITRLLPDPNPKRLTYQQIKAWNQFAGGPGSRADKYKRYVQATGDKSFTLSDLENELGLLQRSLADIAVRKGMVGGVNTHSGDYFPQMIYDGQEAGVVNGSLSAQGTPASTEPQFRGSLDQINEISFNNGRPYFLNSEGDLQYLPMWVGMHPKFRGQYGKDGKLKR